MTLSPRARLLFPLVWLLLNVASLSAWGATPGKKLMRLKVVLFDDAGPLDWKTAGMRSVMTLISGTMAGLGYLWILFDKDRRGWHDLLAGTRVVEQ